jgi:anti-sigma regulatory factor (Ser/Thr protein kinase)
MATADTARADHRLLEYGTDGQFVAHVVPFLSEGLAAGESALVVAPPNKIAAVRDALGPDAGRRVRFADSDSWGSGNVPARVLAIEWTIRKLLATADRCRYVGEFTWYGDGQQREWRRHESAANLLYTSAQVSMLCTVDVRISSAEFRHDLRQTHPVIAPDRANPDFVPPWSYLAELDGNLFQPAPVHADCSMAVGDADLRPMRERVTSEARAAGLGDYQAQCLALAATEVVANAVHHAGTAAVIRTWAQDSRFICEISDKGPGIADPLASYRPPAPAGGRCGLWLARTFCDDLRIVSSPAGTVVQLSFPAP